MDEYLNVFPGDRCKIMMQIKIFEGNWGMAQLEDIQNLLEDVASHIVCELREPFDVTIHVVNLPTELAPKAFFGRQDDPALGDSVYVVNLPAKDYCWSQFTYQFGHEFCHVLSGYDRLRHSVANQWFHESICELASLFVLRRMAERWLANPPHPHWADYSMYLEDYAKSEMAKHESATPKGPFSTWLNANENAMRQYPYLHGHNGVVALRLLQVFEENPEGWNAVRCLPVSEGKIRSYIRAWQTAVEAKDRSFVVEIGNALF